MYLEQLQNLPACSYRVSVKALIRNDQGQVLVVKEGDDYWDLPGGGLEHGESFEMGLRREVAEEVGLEVIVGDVYDVIKFVSVDGIQAMFIIYECQTVGGIVSLGDADEFAWMVPADLGVWPLDKVKGFGAELA